jgi:hypothetical protein
MAQYFDHLLEKVLKMRVRRPDRLSVFIGGVCLCLVIPHAAATATTDRPVIVDRFLGEELTYQIGFWLFPHCGRAKTRFSETERPGVYRASLEGRTVGVMDMVLGRYQYTYVSFLETSPKGDRFRPLRFEFTQKQMGKESGRTVTFDYVGGEIIFFRTGNNGKVVEEKRSMKEGIIYEDYLTLFYNFRYGYYGPLKRGQSYHLPLFIHEGMNALDLVIASREEEERRRHMEMNKENKDFFLRFRVNQEDVSSTSGEIEAWLSCDGVPVQGTIKDVILFGDLWGSLIRRDMRMGF